MNRFKTLLYLYIENKATNQEVDELMGLIDDESNRETFNRVIEDQLDANDAIGVGQTQQERAASLKYILKGEKESRHVRFRFVWAAAATVLLLVAFGIGFYKTGGIPNSFVANATLSVEGKDFVIMPDGSTITLKEGSRITYSKSFGVTDRNVSLTGEAFFDVAHDPSKPFKVKTGRILTTVLGTAFNISTLSEEVVVTVTRGKVAVGDETRRYDVITPNEQLAVNTTTGVYSKAKVDSVEVMKWRDDYFILDGVTIEEAALQIEKRFHVSVIISNEALKNCTISAWFLNNESLEQVVKGISVVQQARFTIADQKVVIDGGIGCREN